MLDAIRVKRTSPKTGYYCEVRHWLTLVGFGWMDLCGFINITRSEYVIPRLLSNVKVGLKRRDFCAIFYLFVRCASFMLGFRALGCSSVLLLSFCYTFTEYFTSALQFITSKLINQSLNQPIT